MLEEIIKSPLICHSHEETVSQSSFCHYETPLRRHGNLMYTATHEIASVVSLPRNDKTGTFILYKTITATLPHWQ